MPEAKAPDPTGKPQDRRKLIAVVYADMVGYSRLIGLHDSGPLDRLRTLHAKLIDPAIGSFRPVVIRCFRVSINKAGC